MKRVYFLSTLILVLTSSVFVACETPDTENSQEVKREMGDSDGGIIIKPKPPINPPIGPKK